MQRGLGPVEHPATPTTSPYNPPVVDDSHDAVRPEAWIDALAELRARRTPCVLVVVAATQGSAPREPGARMVVAEGRLAFGTIGGGQLERLALQHCAALLARGDRSAESVTYTLSEQTGQCCGGRVALAWLEHDGILADRCMQVRRHHPGRALAQRAVLYDLRQRDEAQRGVA